MSNKIKARFLALALVIGAGLSVWAMYANQLNTGAPAYIIGFFTVAPLSIGALLAVIWVAVDWFEVEEIAPAAVAAPIKEDLAGDYARGILDDMYALEWLEDDYNNEERVRTEEWEDIARYMEEEGQDAETIKAARYMFDDSRDSWEEYGGPVSCFFSNDVLDIETISTASASAGISNVSKVQALITFGGPNAWIITSDGEDLDILVNWGGDSVKLWANVPGVASYLYELGAGGE